MRIDRRESPIKITREFLDRIHRLFKLSGRGPKVNKEKPDKKPYGGYYPTNPAEHLDINID